MKKRLLVTFLFVALSTLVATAQTSTSTLVHRSHECVGGRWYSVVAADVLSASYRDEENWAKLLEANPGLSQRLSPSGEHAATIFPRDSICIPAGTVMADFIENGDYAPTLVTYKGPIATTMSQGPMPVEDESGPSPTVVLSAMAGLLALFLFLWWFYFLRPRSKRMAQNSTQTSGVHTRGLY